MVLKIRKIVLFVWVFVVVGCCQELYKTEVVDKGLEDKFKQYLVDEGLGKYFDCVIKGDDTRDLELILEHFARFDDLLSGMFNNQGRNTILFDSMKVNSLFLESFIKFVKSDNIGSKYKLPKNLAATHHLVLHDVVQDFLNGCGERVTNDEINGMIKSLNVNEGARKCCHHWDEVVSKLRVLASSGSEIKPIGGVGEKDGSAGSFGCSSCFLC